MPTSTTPTPDVPEVASLGYEQARDELVAVVARLEAGADSLEESLSLWERGEALAARCQEWLDGARVRLEAARATHDGPSGPGGADPTTAPTTARSADPSDEEDEA